MSLLNFHITLIILLFTSMTVMRSNGEFFIARHMLSDKKINLTCISDSKSAITWTVNSSNKQNRLPKFQPEIPKFNSTCAIQSSNGCLTNWKNNKIENWHIFNSAEKPMYPVFDYRWENFEEIVLDDDPEKKNLYKFIREFPRQTNTVVFSVRGSLMINIYICQNNIPTGNPCVEIAIENCKLNIYFCSKGLISQFSKNACKNMKKKTLENNCKVDTYMWRTFQLQWNKNQLQIRDSSTNLSGDISTNLTDINNIIVKNNEGIRFRFHFYDYLWTNLENVVLSTEEIEPTENNYYIDTITSGCNECIFQVTINSRNKSNNFTIRGNNGWQLENRSYQITEKFSLQIETVLNKNMNYGSFFWAIGYIRIHNSRDLLRISTITVNRNNTEEDFQPKVKCHKLFDKNELVDPFANLSIRDFDTDYFDQAISKLPSFSPNDEKLSICRRQGCICNKGFYKPYCNERCPEGYYYYNCAKRCEGKCNHCNKTTELCEYSNFDTSPSSNPQTAEQCFQLIPGIRNITVVPSTKSECKMWKHINLILEINGTNCPIRHPEYVCSDTNRVQPFTLYNVTLKNSSLVLFSRNIMTLEPAPEKIRNLRAVAVTISTANITWDPLDSKYGNHVYYMVELECRKVLGCRRFMKNGCQEIRIVNVTNPIGVIFKNLHPYTNYSVSVTAVARQKGLPTEYEFTTRSEDSPNVTVGDIRLNVEKNCWESDPPEDCTKITAPSNGINISVECLSDWCKNEKPMTFYSDYDNCSVFNSMPYTTYSAKANIRFNKYIENPIIYKSKNWTTLADAPPEVTNLTIYGVIVEKHFVSLKWKAPYPPYGEIEKYTVSLTSSTHKYSESIETGKCKLWTDYICLENFEIKKNVAFDDVLTFEVYAKNKNVPTHGPKVSQTTTLSELCHRAPAKPKNLTKKLNQYGIVTVMWEHPSLTNTTITKYQINVKQSKTNLLIEINHNIEPTYVKDVNEDIKRYKKTFHLITSTQYHVDIVAVNYCNVTSEKSVIDFEVPPNIGFLNEEKLIVKSTNNSIVLKIPTIVNATKNTTAQIFLGGLDGCVKNNSKELNHLGSLITTYQVKKNLPDNLQSDIDEKINVERTCQLSPDKLYWFTVKFIDHYSNRSFEYNSSSFDLFGNEPDKVFDWSVIIPPLIIGIVLLLSIIFYLRRKKNLCKRNNQNNIPLLPITTNRSILEQSRSQVDLAKPQKSIQEIVPDLISYNLNSHPVKIEEFEAYTEKALSSGLLNSQYMAFPTDLNKSQDYGKLPGNMPKNRYKNLEAYDETRVVLKKIPGDPYSDYINANYIQGYHKAKAYIATQGPKKNTVLDFWRMIWQEEVRVICMLTNIVEGGKEKCEQYWPEVERNVKYGDVLVSNLKHEVFADYTIRTLELSCQNRKRKVTHFHYTGWPDHGIPTYTQSLVTYLKKILATRMGKGPMVVHCSAGIGRTGTIILCDICLRQAVKERVIDIPTVVIRMRNDRTKMINSPQQYQLAHLAIVETMVKQTEIPCTIQLKENIREMRKQLPFDVQRLKDIVWQDRALHMLAEPNQVKDTSENRSSSTQVVRSSTDNRQTNYCIDTVSVDGVQMKKQYLASRLPSPSTLPNLWKLVLYMKVELIVVLQRPDLKNSSLSEIVPNDKFLVLGPHMKVELKTKVNYEEDSTMNRLLASGYFTMDRVEVTDTRTSETKSQTVNVLTCTGWECSKDAKPPPPSTLISVWRASEEIQRKPRPTLVLCHDGITGCGLYLALSFLLERMAVERECDVISAVRAVRRAKPEFVQPWMQFEYLYDAAIYYHDSFSEYANFS